MRKMHGLALGAAILMGGFACAAQETPIPFEQIQRSTTMSAKLAASGRELAGPLSSEIRSGVSTSAPPSATASSAEGIVRVPPVSRQRTLGAKYFLLNGLHLGMAGLDIALTQRCIAEHRCSEGNPIMPSSLAGSISVDSALVGFGAFMSGRLKMEGSKLWWINPVVGIAAHGAGVATGIAHQ